MEIAVDKNKVTTPEGWKLPDTVFAPPPLTAKEAEKRNSEGDDYAEWSFSKKDL